MNQKITANILGLVLGFVIGHVALSAQTPPQDGTQSKPYLITVSGGWNKELKCAAQNVAFMLAIDGGAAVPTAGVTWAPNTGADAATYPFKALFPQTQMPAAVRAIGAHQLVFTQPATTINLADGTPYTYPAATYTEWVTTLADVPTSTPPKDSGWRKILGTLIAFLRSVFMPGRG